MGFATAVDIGNRALQHCGNFRINKLTDISRQAVEFNFLYDKVRDAELRRNVWRFSIRRAVLRPIDHATVLWTPAAWSSSTTYSFGAVVSYGGFYWQTTAASISGGSTPDISTDWHRYFGPITADPFVPAAIATAPPSAPTLSQGAGGSLGARTYYVKITYVTASGETLPSNETSFAVSASNLVTVASPAAATGATGYNVYASTSQNTEGLQNANPINIGTNWTEPTSGLIFGQGPPLVQAASYFAGELVTAGGTVYLSLIQNNTDAPPTPNWLNVGGTTASLRLIYPIGTGPLANTDTKNVLRLPYGFLKRAPQDPKAGINPYLGAPRDLPEDDWLLEGNYIVTAEARPVMIRFQADVIDVYDMDPMFCEGLAARAGKELVPMLVEPEKRVAALAAAREAYNTAMVEARIVNGIETGAEPPPEDDYITCRY